MCRKLFFKGEDYLRCDNKQCEKIIFIPEGITEKHINQKCIDCGSNLLTKEDYDLFLIESLKMDKIFHILNKIFTLGGLIGYKNPPKMSFIISRNMSKTHKFNRTNIYKNDEDN